MRTLFGGSAASAEHAVPTTPIAATSAKPLNLLLIMSLPRGLLRPQSLRPSERIWIGLVLDRHPLPVRELLPVGRTADARAVAGRTGPAERNVRLVGHRLVVDVEQARAQPVAERERAADRLREHAGGQAVLVAVGELDRLVLGGEAGDRRDRAEHLLVEGAHAGLHAGEHGRTVERTIEGAAGVE